MAMGVVVERRCGSREALSDGEVRPKVICATYDVWALWAKEAADRPAPTPIYITGATTIAKSSLTCLLSLLSLTYSDTRHQWHTTTDQDLSRLTMP